MDFVISAVTDAGISKHANQDSSAAFLINTKQGQMAFLIVCDGMGGLAKGEAASASVVLAFEKWINQDLPKLCNAPLEAETIRFQWNALIQEQNQRIMSYGRKQRIQMGTTVVAMLVTAQRYFILNVGDSRAYALSDTVQKLTKDQSLVAREIELGLLPPEMEEKDPRRNVLLQCVGAMEQGVKADFYTGKTLPYCTYLLCSDGFRHEISTEEMLAALRPQLLTSEKVMTANSTAIIELLKNRQERDNITAVLLRTNSENNEGRENSCLKKLWKALFFPKRKKQSVPENVPTTLKLSELEQQAFQIREKKLLIFTDERIEIDETDD